MIWSNAQAWSFSFMKSMYLSITVWCVCIYIYMCCAERFISQRKKMRGSVVLAAKSLLDIGASALDAVDELLGKRVSFRLVSSQFSGPLGNPAYLGKWTTIASALKHDDPIFAVEFDWEEGVGIPGAVIVFNHHHSEFFLKSLTLDGVPGHGRLHFVCNSWVYPAGKFPNGRIFFTNHSYLPGDTPDALVDYRRQELVNLRGNGTGQLEKWDRVYDYAYYNDLGDPDKGEEYARPVLGGSSEYPYPRRGRTGRPPSKTDPETESRISLPRSLHIYIPRDERFRYLKMSDFLAYGVKSILQVLVPEFFGRLCKTTGNEFESFEDVLNLYDGGIKLPDGPSLRVLFDKIPFEFLRETLRRDGNGGLFKFPLPSVLREDRSGWRTDEEFAREMVAGPNPVIIALLHEFPPTSNLDPKLYGDQTSKISQVHLHNRLDGLTPDEAIKANRLFILNHHDALMPYLRRINSTTSKIYATRTLLFLQNDGRLRPVAIELSLPHPDGDELGAVSEVYTPSEDGVEGSIWQLAKAYAAVNDSGVHQLISHWLNTHAVIEPFIIATYRQLSVLHPIHKLLQPHFRDTMNINAFGRQVVIQAGGILEQTVFPGKYSMEMSSAFYKNWVFPDQALPADLLKRGVAVKDSNSPHGLRLLIEDYPYAVDGLKIWSAIEKWVEEYCNFYYASDEAIRKDEELQCWWKEIREVGHGDKKDEKWWARMQTKVDLVESCTTIIWIASALHAALNFGQYPYAGYMPNRPTISRRFMPKEGTPDYEELEKNPDKVFLSTITAKPQTLIGIGLIEVLSRHSSDEVYLGQRETEEWTRDEKIIDEFSKFGKRLVEIEKEIIEMNKDGDLKNRAGGPVKVPYTLLYPNSGGGLTGMGIPNSTSI